MVQKEVVSYIRYLVSRGYNLEVIKGELLKRGYTSQDIDDNVSFAMSGKQVEEETIPLHSRSHTLAITVLLLLIVIFASVMFYFSSFNPLSRTSDTGSIDMVLDIPSIVKAGEILTFTRTLKPSELSSADVSIKYEIKDMDSNFMTSKDETVSLAGEEDFGTVDLAIASLEPGRYLLIAEARYDDKSISKQKVFQVKSSEAETPIRQTVSCFDNVKNQGEEGIDCGGPCSPCFRECPLSCDDKNTCTRDLCGEDTNFRCSHEDIFPCCGNFICESGEEQSCSKDCADSEPDDMPVYTDDPDYEDPFPFTLSMAEKLENVRELASTDTQDALDFCDHIKFENSRDQCYSIVGETVGRQSICENIAEERMKDICISRVAQKKQDSTICDSVSNLNKKDSCYMGFAKDKDFTVCPKISSDYLRQFCEQLRLVTEQEEQGNGNL